VNAAWVPREDVRLLVVDPRAPRARAVADARFADLPRFVAPGDVVVVNDAATLPAMLRGQLSTGAFVEARVIDTAPLRAVLFGPGDHTTRTEDRAPPPRVFVGDRLHVGGLVVRVAAISPISPRLVELSLDGGATEEQLWRALYRAGAPIQYAHRREPLPLWAVQTACATRPWAAEMPSAGRPLTWDLLLALRRRGAEVVALTHAAGLSATGDPALDAALPVPERYDLPEPTARAVIAARRRGDRVIAIGTTVVRALEAAALDRELRPGPGVASLVLTPAHRLRAVDGIVSGVHAPDESHFRLLGAFADADTLAAAAARADALGLARHELGDATLVLPGALAAARAAA
jgi:S-adenosylmethionine:tRNA ribosyltransferase-isomerase